MKALAKFSKLSLGCLLALSVCRVGYADQNSPFQDLPHVYPDHNIIISPGILPLSGASAITTGAGTAATGPIILDSASSRPEYTELRPLAAERDILTIEVCNEDLSSRLHNYNIGLIERHFSPEDAEALKENYYNHQPDFRDGCWRLQEYRHLVNYELRQAVNSVD